MATNLPIYFFFFNDTATTEIYTLSLHDALPILQVLPRSEWKTLFHLSDRVDSSTKVLALMSRIHFWNNWSDWVKIGENFFWVKFSQSCRSHRSEHVYASFTPIWVKNPLPLVRSGWIKYQSACRSEEHTSELQSPCNLVCRLLLEKKNIKKKK